MAYSSILGADSAPSQPSGREAELLGPSDNSDSGSDTIGTGEAREDTIDSTKTGDRGAAAGRDARDARRLAELDESREGASGEEFGDDEA